MLAILVMLAALAGTAPLGAQQAPDGFQPGDVIRLEVAGDSALTGTFTVGPGPALELPVIGAISLAGVRRGDLEAHLTRELGRYLRNPVLRAQTLVRLGILGEVAEPGFYAVPADAVLADALMLAGGPTRDAKMSKLRVERRGARVWEGGALQRALAESRTVDGLGLQSGDRIVVPRRGDFETTVRILGILLTVPAAIYGVSRIF